MSLPRKETGRGPRRPLLSETRCDNILDGFQGGRRNNREDSSTPTVTGGDSKRRTVGGRGLSRGVTSRTGTSYSRPWN